MALLDRFSKEEFEEIVSQSNSWRDLSRNLGYNCHSGDLKTMIQKKIDEYQLDVSHFKTVNAEAIERSRENVFIENSTACQKVLREWYKKEQDIPYQCSICGQPPIWQSKPLTLILDHINGINNDDRLENLRWVCPNCNMQLPTTNRPKPKEKKKYYCIDCGAEVSSKNVKRCASCNAKHSTIALEDMPVTREELKKLIRTTPFTKIGEKFNVSDNTIRKWCDKFSLPRKVTEIRKYSDDDWLKI